MATTWQRLSMGRNVLRASGLLLAPGVVAGCTWSVTLGAQPQLCSSLPVWLSPLQKTTPLLQCPLFPATRVIQPLPACASSHNLPLNAARWSELAHTPRRHLQLPALREQACLTCCWSGLPRAFGRWGMFGCCRGWLWEVPGSDSCIQTCTNSLRDSLALWAGRVSDHIPVSTWTDSQC